MRAMKPPKDEPQTWEPMVERCDRSLDRFSRADGLEAWEAKHGPRVQAESEARTRSAERLYHDLPNAIGGLLGADPSPIWATLLETLGIVCRETAWRIGGIEVPDRVRAGKRGPAVFGSVGQALEFALYSEHVLGQGDGHWVREGKDFMLAIADDRDEDVQRRARLLHCGRAVPAGPRLVATRPQRKPLAKTRPAEARSDKTIAFLDHIAEVTGEALDLPARDYNHEPQPVPAPNLSGNSPGSPVLPVRSRHDRRAPGGFLPVEFMQTRQSSNGCLGGTKSAGSVGLRLDVLGALARTRIGGEPLTRTELLLLFATDAGLPTHPDGRAHLTKSGELVPAMERLGPKAVASALTTDLVWPAWALWRVLADERGDPLLDMQHAAWTARGCFLAALGALVVRDGDVVVGPVRRWYATPQSIGARVRTIREAVQIEMSSPPPAATVRVREVSDWQPLVPKPYERKGEETRTLLQPTTVTHASGTVEVLDTEEEMQLAWAD